MNYAIQVENISKSFKRKTVIKDSNINVKYGEVVGIVGGNGSGKSLLFKLICGLERIDQGNIYIRGSKLGVDFDFPENLGALINAPGYIGSYTGIKNLQLLASINNQINDDKIIETLKLVGLDPFDKTKVKNYSSGMKQKLGIAQAIMEEQDIIILDEPFNALDFKTNKEIKELIKIIKNQNKTIMLTSHNHNDLEELCDSIYFIDEGTIVQFEEDIKQMYFG